MKKAIPILLLMLLQGCMTWSRHWDLGVCRESSIGIYSCAVRIPKCSAVVHLIVKIHHENTQKVGAESMTIRIQNKESHAIEIQGIAPFVHLKPDASYELITPRLEINDIDICSFDTHSGSIKVIVDVLSGKPAEATISIAAGASDGP